MSEVLEHSLSQGDAPGGHSGSASLPTALLRDAQDGRAVRLGADRVVAVLKAAAEPTRLRILALLAVWELTVKDLTQVLGQSQPRISRHLKLLAEAGLVDRHREGTWVNVRLAEEAGGVNFAQIIIGWLDRGDDLLRRDLERARALVEARAARAQAYFAENAGEWDAIRALHMDEAGVETAMQAMLGGERLQAFLDLGTGTGRLLELFAPIFERGIGIDTNPEMLSYARSRIEAAGLRHAQVRQGDIYNLNLPDDAHDAVVMHQVLHFLTEPDVAVREAARVVAPGGRLMVVDFAPHDHDVLRDRFAHSYLGISDERMAAWLAGAGLELAGREPVPPPAGGHTQSGLTVLIWLARKPLPSATARDDGASPI